MAATTAMHTDRFWDALARGADRVARILGSLARRAEALAKRLAAAVERLQRLAVWARCRAKGLPLGADLAGDEWKQAPALPPVPVAVAVKPPPIPVMAGFERRNTVTPLEEEREWQAAIECVKTAADAAEWTAAIEQAKARANPPRLPNLLPRKGPARQSPSGPTRH